MLLLRGGVVLPEHAEKGEKEGIRAVLVAGGFGLGGQLFKHLLQGFPGFVLHKEHPPIRKSPDHHVIKLGGKLQGFGIHALVEEFRIDLGHGHQLEELLIMLPEHILQLVGIAHVDPGHGSRGGLHVQEAVSGGEIQKLVLPDLLPGYRAALLQHGHIGFDGHAAGFRAEIPDKAGILGKHQSSRGIPGHLRKGLYAALPADGNGHAPEK